MNLLDYHHPDGAHPVAQVILQIIRYHLCCDSNDYEDDLYDNAPQVSRWHNCREQGYITSVRTEARECLQIAFAQHRSSDSISVLVWEQERNVSGGPITIETAMVPIGPLKADWVPTRIATWDQWKQVGAWIAYLIELWYRGDTEYARGQISFATSRNQSRQQTG